MATQIGVYKLMKTIDKRRLAKYGDGKIEIITDYVLGRCVPSVKTNAAKILVNQLVLDERLNRHFEETDHVFAYDPEKKVKSGDIVLVRKLPEKKTTLITHAIEKIVYKFGDIIDPLTNKAVVGSKYRDDIEMKNQLYGKVDTAFDYKKAPPRGRLEGTRDFTDKPTYTKFYAECTDPYAW